MDLVIFVLAFSGVRGGVFQQQGYVLFFYLCNGGRWRILCSIATQKAVVELERLMLNILAWAMIFSAIMMEAPYLFDQWCGYPACTLDIIYPDLIS
ncbi:LOW QUALITY PROTEIN: hypothetical protein YC2023_046497 [Brassica napus]